MDLVLSGHSHAYQRSYLIRGHYGPSTSWDPSIHLVDGGDGCPDDERVEQGEAGRQFGGSGLGLMIAKRIVELHGGRIWIESAGEGRGSTFRFTLPLFGAGAQSHAPVVVVAAADSLTRREIRRVAEETGFAVEEAADGVEAVEACSPCYGSLVHALQRLSERGCGAALGGRLCIGQGFKGRSGPGLGIGTCTRSLERHLPGCPPTAAEIVRFLRGR